jgi:DNA polymerase-3 subunit gamma/tau
MGFDTKYRPKSYDEVLGQKATISILKEVVKKGKGFRQSYCFQGPFGTGKTTLARIFAKALLCENPQEGNPCKVCSSCQIINSENPHPDIVEVDAASNSRKEDIEKIIEEIKYNSFSGRHKIYIFDESHNLSKYSQEALLLPLENTLPNSEDKQLVCIFCTTEPAKMRTAILSRCAPAFEISLLSSQEITSRLISICEKEEIEYEEKALSLLAEIKEGHVRDCIIALESLSPFGKIIEENILKFLQLNYNDELLDILLSLREEDTSSLPDKVETLGLKLSPSFMYEKFSQLVLLAFKAQEGSILPSYLNSDKVKSLHEIGKPLVKWVRVFSSRPYNSSIYTLICDLYLCQEILNGRPLDGASVNNFTIPIRSRKISGNIKKAGISQGGVFVNPSARNVEKDFIKSSQEEEIKEDDFSSSLENALKGFKDG